MEVGDKVIIRYNRGTRKEPFLAEIIRITPKRFVVEFPIIEGSKYNKQLTFVKSDRKNYCYSGVVLEEHTRYGDSTLDNPVIAYYADDIECVLDRVVLSHKYSQTKSKTKYI